MVGKNYRILELAHWVREALKPVKKVEIEVDYTTYKTRSYRVSGERIETVLGVKPLVGRQGVGRAHAAQIDAAQPDATSTTRATTTSSG